jgi:hypothetical protein
MRPCRCSGLRRRCPTPSTPWTPPCGWSWSARNWPRVPRIVLADLRDPVLSPFVSAAALTAMLLAAALATAAPTAGRVLVIVSVAVTTATAPEPRPRGTAPGQMTSTCADAVAHPRARPGEFCLGISDQAGQR